MLMMPRAGGVGEKVRAADAHDAAADAHDAGRLAGSGKKYGQLMLMMLAVWRGWGKSKGS